MPPPKPRLPRPRARWLAVLALVVAAAVVVVIVVSNNKPASRGSGAGTTATGAATVQRRNLVATDTESGTLSYANSQTVYNRLSGTITWVPQVGAVIHAGQTLFNVDNKPVLLMDGSTPAYRELSATDVKGPDVYELNRNLVDLGYNPDGIVVDDEWQSATTAGIDELQYHLGEAETGKLTLGQVVFLPGPQMVQTVDTTVGSTAAGYTAVSDPLFVDYSNDSTTTSTDTTATGTGTTGTGTTGTGTTGTTGTGTSMSGSSTTPRSTTPGSSTTPNSSTTPKSSTAPKSSNSGTDSLSTRTLQALLRLVQQQQRELQAEQRANHSPRSNSGSPSHGGHNPSNGSGSPSTGHTGSTGHSGTNGHSNPSHNSGNGGGAGGGGAATAVLGTSSTKLVVTVDLSPSSQSEARIGEHVTVQMPNGGSVGGRVAAVSPVATSSSSGGNGSSGAGGGGNGGSGSGSSTVPVTIVLDRRARGGGLDQASVSVDFVQSKASHVLSVPVTALLATSGSSFAVQQAASPHRLIAVRTGLFAAGYVEISGAGIHPGLKVTDSQG